MARKKAKGKVEKKRKPTAKAVKAKTAKAVKVTKIRTVARKPAKAAVKKPAKKAAKRPATKAAKPKAAAKKLVTADQEIKDAQKQGRLLIGTRTVFKGIKRGMVADVFHATNMPENLIKDLDYYVRVSGIALNKFNGDSAKLGQLCGKPFKILLTAIKK